MAFEIAERGIEIEFRAVGGRYRCVVLTFQERPAAGDPAGLLVLHHGRGTDEFDLLPLADLLDPQRRLHVVTPRAPQPYLSGWRWYEPGRVGYPEATTFRTSYHELAGLHDELRRQTGLTAAATVLGGFSMGTAMSFALGLGADRPAPAGILAFSGFIPTVEGWEADLENRNSTQVFIAHGSHDPVIDVSFSRDAREQLEGAGFDVSYHESEAVHQIDPALLPVAQRWLANVIG